MGKQFKGDDRTFGQPGTSRLWMKFVIDTDKLGPPWKDGAAIVSQTCGADTSHQRVKDGDNWTYSIPLKSTPTYQFTPYNHYAGITGTYGSAYANYPYTTVSPNIDMTILLMLRKNGNDVDINYSLYRNCFPFYEVVVDRGGKRTPIYQYTPWWSGPGVIGLWLTGGRASDTFTIKDVQPTDKR